MIDLLIGPISALLSKVVPDVDKRNELAHEIATMSEKQIHDRLMAQMEVNKQEAAHKSLFVAGWRPGAGWVCVIAMATNYVILPLLSALSPSHSVDPFDMSVMMPLLLGMLGLGAARTTEKLNKVAREK